MRLIRISQTLRKLLLRSSCTNIMTNLFIEIIILFVLLVFYFSVANSHNNNWLRALVLAVALPVLGILPNYMGVIGWIIAIIVALALISKLICQSFSGSLLFLMVLGLVQYIIQLGIY